MIAVMFLQYGSMPQWWVLSSLALWVVCFIAAIFIGQAFRVFARTRASLRRLVDGIAAPVGMVALLSLATVIACNAECQACLLLFPWWLCWV